MSDARDAYTRGHRARLAEATAHARVASRLSNARLIVFLAFVALAIAAGVGDAVPGWSVAPALAVFLALVVWHDQRLRAQRNAERAAAFHERGLARLDDRWPGAGATGERFLGAEHLYTTDLDVFGDGSLFQRLCCARTRAGEETLAAWLMTPAAPDEVTARQHAVAELAPRLDLREALALLGDDIERGVASDALVHWSNTPIAPPAKTLRIVAALFAIASSVTLAAWISGAALALPFFACIAAQSVFSLTLRGRVRAGIAAVSGPGRELAVVASLLARVEQESFASPRLRALRAALDTDGRPPSIEVARLRRLTDWLDARHNQIFAPIAGLLLWGTQFALAVEAWRARTGPQVPRWLAAVGELEALCSLAGYAFERPQDTFPEFVTGHACFDADGLAHPLLPAARSVRNSLRLDATQQALLVSGSNMSGKSTLLRSVGVATVLAQAGAPVCATRLVLSPLAVGASIRVADSLLGGRSRFYAEITRLGDVVRTARDRAPLLFLLDEVLAGTNSHDRRIGAAAIVRGLVERGAIGLVTTHDLALADIADTLAPRVVNVHFEDHLDDEGRIAFDYQLRPGVVTRSNAIALMRAVGLEV